LEDLRYVGYLKRAIENGITGLAIIRLRVGTSEGFL
jgi:hypothetical protein